MFSICGGGGCVLVGAVVEVDAEMGFVGERSVGLGGVAAGERGGEVFGAYEEGERVRSCGSARRAAVEG